MTPGRKCPHAFVFVFVFVGCVCVVLAWPPRLGAHLNFTDVPTTSPRLDLEHDFTLVLDINTCYKIRVTFSTRICKLYIEIKWVCTDVVTYNICDLTYGHKYVPYEPYTF